MPSKNTTPIFTHRDRGASVTISKGDDSSGIYRKRPALKAVDDRPNEIYLSVTDKLVGENKPLSQRNDKDNIIEPDQSYIKELSDDTALSVSEANSMLDALPDLELSKLIIVSSIISPNDMISNKLIYGCNTDIFRELTTQLVSVIENYFNNAYKIKKLLPEMIGKAIFTDGAYPMVVLPESSIDEVINSNLTVTSESFDKFVSNTNEPLGIIGNPTTPKKRNINHRKDSTIKPSSAPKQVELSFESITSTVNVKDFDNVLADPSFNTTITDNPATLRVPRLVDKVRHQSILNKYAAYSISGETFTNTLYKANADIKNKNKISEGNLYPMRKNAYEPIISIKDPLTLEKENVGHPVVLTPPSEACIPVFKPGDPSHHVGYFIVLDETGNPIGASAHEDQFKNLSTYSSMNSSASSITSSSSSSTSLTTQYKQMAGLTNSLSQGESSDDSTYDPVKSAAMYGSIIENELIERLENGTYANKLTVAKATDIYRMMFTRACMQMKTQLVYVPAEFVTYLAYDYKRNGIGRSLLERTKAIGSLRMINMMSKALANIKSSTNLRRLEIVVDPDDPAPLKTVEQRIHEFMQATKAEFPIGQMNFADIAEALQKAGVSVHVTGTEKLPDTSMELDYRNINVTPPDDEYDTSLQRQQIMGFGIPPDAVNSATDVQFATSIVTYNFLSAKINLMRQEITCEALSDFMRKYSMNSRPIIKDLTKVIDDNREMIDTNELLKQYDSKALALVFINHIEIGLPEADLTKLEAELDAFEKYSQGLDTVLEAFISEELFNPTLVGDRVADKMRDIVPVVKKYFQRRYLAEHNMFPEMFDLISSDSTSSESFSLFDEFQGYIDSLLPAFRKFILRMLKGGSRSNAVMDVGEDLIAAIDKLNDREEASAVINGTSGTDTTDSDEDSATDDSGGDMFDDDDPFSEETDETDSAETEEEDSTTDDDENAEEETDDEDQFNF